MENIQYREITHDDLETYKALILPMIFNELSDEEKLEESYICIGAWTDDKPVGAIITLMNEDGGLSLLSIWTDQKYRRQGVASGLLQKMTYVAFRLYDWQDMQYGDDVDLTTMYSLSERHKAPFEAWLRKNNFTDFLITKQAEGDKPAICAAIAEIHYYRNR